jgi:hypothetical protein
MPKAKSKARGRGRPRIFEGPSAPFSTRVPAWLLEGLAALAAAEGLPPAAMRRELVLRGYKQTMRKLRRRERALALEMHKGGEA